MSTQNYYKPPVLKASNRNSFTNHCQEKVGNRQLNEIHVENGL